MDISAEISALKYKPNLCRILPEFSFDDLALALPQHGSFFVTIDKTNKIALSWWVSAKRTRSYPFARVYDTLAFSGKKVTVIPLLKDEGKDGDRDFLQWDTISLMSLLGVYTIVAYYVDAEKNPEYNNKITKQKYDIAYLKKEISTLLTNQSDALHWNIDQISKVGGIGQKALQYYTQISKKTNVVMHSQKLAEARIDELQESMENFKASSRKRAKDAQTRESQTIQPKEKLFGNKATLTIKNFLGGCYYFTADEVKLTNDIIMLIEGKHSKSKILPSEEDIKDGLIKMDLFSNLTNVKINNKIFHVKAILKLTSALKFDCNNLTPSQKKLLDLLKKEALENNFTILINNMKIEKINI